MNKTILLLACLIASLCCQPLGAQPRYPDERWPIGVNEFPGTSGYGNAWLVFQNGEPTVQPAQLNMNFEAAVAVATDTLGNVLFYSNGCEIRGADGALLENGQGLNPGPLHDWVCGQVGYTAPRSMMALPWPGQHNRWALLHLGGEYDPSRKLVYGPLYLTEVDMAANGGKGSITVKNQPLATGDLEPFAVVRHGNGRDWWIVMPEYGSNWYQVRLLSPAGISPAFVQAIGPKIGCRRVGSSIFSPDGGKYARTNSCMAVTMDFDRCTGTLVNPQPLPRDPGMLGGGGLAFSPDNRWLYATTNLCIFRADLADPAPFLDSLYKRPYAFVDEPPVSDYVYGTSLTYMQAAPDGRLYMAARHRERYYPCFTIQGKLYAFEPEGQKLPVPTVRTLPHFPNFRLYDLLNSPCDTIGINGGPWWTSTGEAAESQIQVRPNPFRERFAVALSANLRSPALRLHDAAGRLVLEQRLVLGVNEIEAAGLPPGLYFWEVVAGGERVKSGKLVKTDKQ